LLGVEQWAEIRRMSKVERLSQREIHRRDGVHRDTIRRALASPEPPSYCSRSRRPSNSTRSLGRSRSRWWTSRRCRGARPRGAREARLWGRQDDPRRSVARAAAAVSAAAQELLAHALPPARQAPRRPTRRPTRRNRLTDHPRRPRRGPQTSAHAPVSRSDPPHRATRAPTAAPSGAPARPPGSPPRRSAPHDRSVLKRRPVLVRRSRAQPHNRVDHFSTGAAGHTFRPALTTLNRLAGLEGTYAVALTAPELLAAEGLEVGLDG
jgi:hypothetical protein